MTDTTALPTDLGADTLIAESTPVTPVIPRPRIRAGAIVWGLFVIGIGVTTLSVVADASRRAALFTWATTLTPGGAVLVGVIAIGAVLLLLGVLGAISRAQRPRDGS